MDARNKNKRVVTTVVLVLIGLLALHNQRLTVTDPENTYPKRIKRAIRLMFNPAETELEKHLIGKGIACQDAKDLYLRAAGATVVIETESGTGAGVFIGPELIVTAKHVVDGRKVSVSLPKLSESDLASPGRDIPVDRVIRVQELDLAFIRTRGAYPHWLPLDSQTGDDRDLLVVGHPNRKYYSLQKGRIKKKSLVEKTPYLFFKDNEVFFGNSGGTIVNCDGALVAVVSMMSDFQNSMRKQGIGINARTIAEFANRLGLHVPSQPEVLETGARFG